jgi:hypothetical protein
MEPIFTIYGGIAAGLAGLFIGIAIGYFLGSNK